MVTYKFPYWDATIDRSYLRKTANSTRIVTLMMLIKQQPIPDKVKLAAINDILWMVNNSQEVSDSIKLDVSNIGKFGKALGSLSNIFSWANTREGYEFWWKMFQIINS